MEKGSPAYQTWYPESSHTIVESPIQLKDTNMLVYSQIYLALFIYVMFCFKPEFMQLGQKSK